MTYDSKWIPMPEMVDPGRDAASPAGAEAVARLIYEGMGYDYNARTINARGEPYGKWGVAVRIAEAIARHATPSTDAVRRQAREEALEEAARIAERHGVYPELNVWGGPEWYRHGQEIAKALRALAEEAR